MATLAPPGPDVVEEVTAAPRGRRKRLLVLLLLLVLAGGALAVRTLLPATDATAAAHEEPEPGPIVQLDVMTLNLADGRFLKLGLALQLTEGAAPEPLAEGEEAGAAVDGAPAQDAAIGVLGERTYAQLLAPGGRRRAQEALQKEVIARYKDKVMRVYFTEFVMQ